MSDIRNQDGARAADCKSPVHGVLELLERGEGVCLGKLAFSLSSLFLRTELVVRSSLKVKKKPENDA